MATRSSQSMRRSESESSETSIKEARERLRHAVDDLSLTRDVIDLLLPSGVPHEFESELWDYKERLPVLADKPSPEDRKSYDAELAGIMKDALAFHNAYGGYILFGVSDKGRSRVKGCGAALDCGDFNKRFQAYTGVSIECLFKRFEVGHGDRPVEVGVLLVPRRAGPHRPRCGSRRTGQRSRTAIGASKKRSTSGCAMNAGLRQQQTRIGDSCIPIASRPSSARVVRRREVVSRLPARDPDLVEFVGRAGPLGELRAWLSDPRSRCA